MIDITDLENKVNNSEQESATASIDPNEKLDATEFIEKLVKPIIELQENTVRQIKRGSQTYTPTDGVVTFPSEGTSVSIATSDSTDSLVCTGGSVVLHVRVISTEDGSDTGNNATVLVQRYVNSDWTTIYTTSLPTRSASSTIYDDLDITDVVPDGASMLRVVATDDGTSGTGRLLFQSVVKATLTVSPSFDWNQPVTDLTNGLQLSYAITGTDVTKTMHLNIYDNTGKNYRELTYVIGTATYTKSNPWSPATAPTDSSTDTVKILSHGVHTIEAWVSCESDGVTYSSPHVKNQVMVVADETSTKSYLMMQQVVSSVENYVQTDPLFKFAVYNPANPADGTKVSFVVQNYDRTEEYFTLEQMAVNGTQYSVPATIQIESATQGQTSYAYLYASDADGNNFLVGDNSLIIEVDNTYNFMPTSGADFYLNPANRNNSEEDPCRILNAAKSNAEIESTFTGMNMDENDGWIQSSDGQRVLRIRAGQKVEFAYDPFSQLKATPASSMTLELDVKISNVTNESDPIIDIANDVAASGMFIGIRMAPLEGVIMTSSQTTEGQQNFGWREDTRTHIAINICSALYADTESNTTIPLVRVFVNGNPYREFMFAIGSDSGEWGTTDVAHSVAIGQTGADIDIYSVKCYKKALSSQNVMQDYKSAMPTSAEKLEFNDANDILGSDGTISYEKASQKYSCIVHHGVPTSIKNKEATTCWLHIDHFVDGVYDKDTSGDICKTTKYCPVKGQGSTAKHYCDWNQQYDPKKAVVPATDLTTPYIEKTNDDGSITRLPAITVDGELVQDGWIDGNGTYKGTYYQLSTSDAKAQKLVGKINVASSMQSHKMGGINSYNDLYRSVMTGNGLDTIMAADSKARCTCKEDWFLFFVQETDSDTPRYEGIMTFGSGKMDKKTWGYDEDDYPDFGMFEGSDNDQPIANFQRPWNDDVTYNPSEEYYEYNGKGQIDFDAGATTTDSDGKEIPTGNAVTAIKAFINFGYLHCTDLKPWTTSGGTATSLIAAADTIDTNYQYWVTAADDQAARGDLYSWSPKDTAWVKAGLDGTARNVFTENPSVEFSADYDATNDALIEAIITRFKTNAGTYFNVRSCLFHSCYVQNLLAGSDNCAKNTYYVVDPTTHLICFHADDLDTIFKTDNVGWQTKAYYVDREHHVDDDGNETYSGTHNFFFNTFDRAYDSEKQTMMSDIFTAMASLSGSVTKFFESYFFSTQRSIPCIAYIEQARMRYEKRQIDVNDSIITLDTVNPITQQLGSQLESELQYMDRRLVYFESYAAYGEWREGGGGNNFGFRGYPKRDGTAARIAFTLVAHQYLYPTGAFGSTTINPHYRLKPGESYELLLEKACASDTTCSLKGIDYYREIGNLGDLSVNPSYEITIGGERLTKVIAEPTDSVGEFRPSGIKISAKLVEEVSINCQDVGTSLDLSSQTRLQSVNLQNTGITRVTLPSTQTLTSIKLGEKLTTLSLSGLPNLTTLTMQGAQYLESITIGSGVTSLDTRSLVVFLYNQKQDEDAAVLKTLSMAGVSWGSKSESTGVTATVMNWICSIANVSVSGTANIVDSVNASLKMLMIDTFGDVDSTDNSFYVTYSAHVISSLSINGAVRIRKAGTYQYSLVFAPTTANNFTSIKWSIDENNYATIDENTGLLTATTPPQEKDDTPTANVTATVTLTDGTTNTATMKIYLYNRVPKVGDWAYSDGDFDEILHTAKTVIGWVYRVVDNGDNTYTCHVQAASNLAITSSNGTTYTSFPWGIYTGASYTPQDVVTQIATDLGLTDSQVRDITALANRTTTGLNSSDGSSTNYSYVKDYNAYDDTQADGFAVPATGSVAADWNGAANNDYIVAHAKEIIAWAMDNIKINDVSLINTLGWDHDYPKSMAELADLLVALKNANTSADLRELAYPAAVGCALYEPTADNLDEQYKAGKWYLPAGGDLVRQYIFFRNSRSTSPADSGTPVAANSDIDNSSRAQESTEARRPWYANLLKRASGAGNSCPVSLPSQSGAWSSTEINATVAWNVSFSSGNVSDGNKYLSLVVRPSAAFTFTL